jgi:DUF1365 family protein
MHNRLEPKKHHFAYDIFMFYLDLDEIDVLSERLWFLSRNRLNLFSFRDRDHLKLSGRTVKENILEYLSANGMDLKGGRVMLLTNLATLGYAFNPVSFYFCFNDQNAPVCAVAEVGNTYGELKPYFFGGDKLQNGSFIDRTTKYFYVSPFVDMDTEFDFKLAVPDENLNIQINDFQNSKKFFVSSLTGRQEKLSDGALLWFFLRFPFITLQVITLIHWQALKLYLKKLPYHKKNDNLDLQREVYHGRHA